MGSVVKTGSQVDERRKGMRTGEFAGEGFLARVGSEVRDKCEARGLGETTTSARGPFTGVVGFVHAYVICGGHENVRALRRNEVAKERGEIGQKAGRTFVQVAYERVQVVKGGTAVFPLTSDDVRRRRGIRWLATACGRTWARSSRLSAVMGDSVIGRSAVLR
jgi:hypothetical protein